MKIRDLHVDGFGVWGGLKLDKLSETMTVLHGPNEAGKTTLMQFIRAVFYGFSTEHYQRYLPPLRGERTGGSLRIDTRQGEFLVTRGDDPDVDGDNPGIAQLADSAGALPVDVNLTALLSEIDEQTFNNIYAVGIRELQELGTLSDSAAAESLYNLTAGLDRVSLSDVVRELKHARRRLLAPDDQPSRIAELINRRDALRQRIDALATQTEEYLALCEQRDDLEPRVREIQRETTDIERRMRMIEMALSLRPRWESRAETEAKLTRCGQPRPVRPQVLDELKQLDEQLSQHRREQRELKHHRAALQEGCDHLAFNEALWNQGPRIEAAADHRDLLELLQRQSARLQQRQAKLKHRAQQYRQRPGLKATVAQGESGNGIEKHLSELKRLSRSIHDKKKLVAKAETSVSKANSQVAELTSQLHARLGTDPSEDLASVLEQSGDRVSQSRRRVQLDERLEKLAHEKHDLEETSDRMIERQLLSGKALLGIGAMFVVGIAGLLLLLASTVFPIADGSTSYGWLGVLFLLSTSAAIVIKYFLEQDARRQMNDVQEQLDTVHRQIAKLREERDELDVAMPGSGGPMVVRLQNAEQQHSTLEELLPLESQRKTALAKVEAATQRASTTRQDLQTLEEQWQHTLRELDLPRDWSPKQLSSLALGRKRLATLTRRQEQLQEDIDVQQQTLSSMARRIAELVDAAELEAPSDDPLEQLAYLSRELAAQQDIAHRRNELKGELRQLDRQRSKVRRLHEESTRRRLDLLNAYECEDEAQLSEAVAQRQRYDSLMQRREELQREIAAALQKQFTEREIDGLLDQFDVKGLEQQWDALTNQHTQRETRREELLEERGRIAERLNTLAESRELAECQLEIGEVEIQLHRAISEWQAVATTDMLLGTIRDEYQRERQPETLREASGYFQKLTGDAYHRVWTPLEEDVLLVDDAEGNTLSAKVLSRGTREQLFLSLRLALIAGYARRDIYLPLVLDDLLVNFDNTRAKATARLLRDFAAEGHQILLFTCHDHIVKLFRGLKVDVRRLPRNSEATETPTEAPEVIEKPRRPRKPEEPRPEEPPKVDSVDEILATLEPEKPTVILDETPVVEEAIVEKETTFIATEDYEAADTVFPDDLERRRITDNENRLDEPSAQSNSDDDNLSRRTRAVAYETWQSSPGPIENDFLAEARSTPARRTARRIDAAGTPSLWHWAAETAEDFDGEFAERSKSREPLPSAGSDLPDDPAASTHIEDTPLDEEVDSEPDELSTAKRRKTRKRKS